MALSSLPISPLSFFTSPLSLLFVLLASLLPSASHSPLGPSLRKPQGRWGWCRAPGFFQRGVGGQAALTFLGPKLAVQAPPTNSAKSPGTSYSARAPGGTPRFQRVEGYLLAKFSSGVIFQDSVCPAAIVLRSLLLVLAYPIHGSAF